MFYGKYCANESFVHLINFLATRGIPFKIDSESWENPGYEDNLRLFILESELEVLQEPNLPLNFKVRDYYGWYHGAIEDNGNGPIDEREHYLMGLEDLIWVLSQHHNCNKKTHKDESL